MKRVAIIQGRMTSSRLPGKILADIAGMPLLAHVIVRAQASSVFDAVVMATSTDVSDDPVEAFCASAGFDCFRGSLPDVLERYYQAARSRNAVIVTRLTADCPMLDPSVIRTVVEAFDPKQHDYVSNSLDRTYPDGLDTEVFSMEALTKARDHATLPSEREHVTSFFYTHPDQFRIAQVTQQENRSDLRWTVDEPKDLAFVRAVFQELGTSIFGQQETLDLLARKPDLQTINAGISLNEGYKRSLAEDAAESSQPSPQPL